LDKGRGAPLGVVIGICPGDYPPDLMPGWGANSVGFHCGEGLIFRGRPRGFPHGSPCSVGDRIALGFRQLTAAEGLPSSSDFVVVLMKNGREIPGVPPLPWARSPDNTLYPAVGLQYPGEEVSVRQGLSLATLNPVMEEDAMVVDGGEDEWQRLHDIISNGQMLEYVGRGNSLGDVGLAQAKMAVGTRNHYFEIEIVDPGERCANGLAFSSTISQHLFISYLAVVISPLVWHDGIIQRIATLAGTKAQLPTTQTMERFELLNLLIRFVFSFNVFIS